MALRLHPPEALLDGVVTALSRDRPIAFVLGSALSSPSVPDSAGVVAAAQAALSAYPSLREALDQALAGAPWGEEYAVAMDLVRAQAGDEDATAVVRRSVHQARLPAAARFPDDHELELDLDGWQLTPGLAALGALLAEGTGGLQGPVLSLAWDPLLEVAIRRAGGRVERRVLDSEGALHRTHGDGGGVELVHLHGFWRDPGSLATRPTVQRLVDGLGPLLRDHAIVVLGAGPRDDTVLQALVQIVAPDDAQATLSWAFHSDDRVQVKADAAALLERVEPLVQVGRFRTFGGVDAHAWLPALALALAPPAPEPAPEPPAPEPEPAPPPAPKPPPRPTLAGWTPIDRRLMAAPLDEAAWEGFLAGQTPSWGVVCSGRLAERDRVKELETALTSKRASKRGWSVHLLLGPDGEGRSTTVRQVATRMARLGGPWRVLFHDGGGLRWDQVGPTLEPGTRVLLVADDAEDLLRRQDLEGFLDDRRLTGRLKRCGAAVHLLLTANAEAWRQSIRNKPRWLQHEAVLAHRSLHALGPAEGLRFAQAAEASGTLGGLAALPDADVRGAVLVGRSVARTDAQLLGALIQGRTDQTLEEHVSGWLRTLQGDSADGPAPALGLWLHVAALQVTGLGGVDRRILGSALGLDDDGLDAAIAALGGWVRALDLGRSRQVTSQAPAVAHTTLAVLDGLDLGISRSGVYASLATATIVGVPRYHKERRLHGIPLLAEKLWRSGDRESGRAMASAAHRAAPLDPGFVRVHARLLRDLGQPTAGVQACAEWAAAVRERDRETPLDRVTLQEWAACARADASAPDRLTWTAWLSLFAMADQPGGKLRKDAIRAVLGIADALAELDPEGTEPRAVQGRAAAVAALQNARKGTLGPRELKARDVHIRAVGSLWRHLSPGAVGACLSGVAALAWERSAPERHLDVLAADGRLTFTRMAESLQR